MRYIIVKWPEGCSGNQYTIHAVESLNPTVVFWAIDELSDPSRCVWKSISKTALQKVPGLKALSQKDHDGYIDDKNIDVKKLWKNCKNKEQSV